jgi:hypothetical protein
MRHSLAGVISVEDPTAPGGSRKRDVRGSRPSTIGQVAIIEAEIKAESGQQEKAKRTVRAG